MSISSMKDPLSNGAGIARRPHERLIGSVAGARHPFLPHLGILTVFWVYVTISNILYANSMQASLASMSVEHFFAPWDSRLVQHILLYPLLLGCVWMSLRTGWHPWPRAALVQLGCALLFAVPASPMLMVGEMVTGSHGAMSHSDMGHPGMSDRDMMGWSKFLSGPDTPVWLASATTFLLTYGFALALTTGFAYYQRYRDSQLRSAALERELTSAHLAALRMQLSPHTLFNLLHTIRGHIAWDPVAAQSMVVQLGDLLRRLLTAGEREFSRLTDECQFVRLYLELQQRRFSDRLTLSVPDCSTLPPVWVPSLILQPLVENAVVHGLAGHEGPVVIRVDAIVSDETLSLRVVNTIGPGRPIARVGIGLRNIRERLAIQFGDRASFSAMPGYDNVWIAEIRMPLLRDLPPVTTEDSAELQSSARAEQSLRRPARGSEVTAARAMSHRDPAPSGLHQP